MAEVRFKDRRFQWASGESLLDCLERNQVDVASSCRSGACHSCLVKVTQGPISPIAQLGLKETWKQQQLCLACVSTEPADITVATSDTSVQVAAKLSTKELLGRDVVRLRLVPSAPFPIRAGQFVNLTRGSDGLTRSYSVASLESDGHVELHIRVVAGGRMSGWVQDELAHEHEVSLRGPSGDCFYVEGRPDQPLLLIGTGTGLAPLYGIVRDALARSHRGSIALVHGGRGPEDLYLDVELRRLAKKHPNFRYLPTLSQGEAMPGTFQGRVDKVVEQQFQTLAGFRVFLCGSPAMVNDARALAYRLHASLDDILADAFIPAPPPKGASRPAIAAVARSVALPVLPSVSKAKPFKVKEGVPRMQKVRFAVQTLIFAGFLAQAVLYYLARFRPMGSLLPFMAYDSLGHMVVSSTLVLWATLFLAVFVFGRFACGWLCPLGYIQDVGEKVLKLIKLPPRRPLRQSNAVRFGMASLVLGHFVVMPVLAAPVRVWQFDWLYREPWLLGFPFRFGLFALDLLLLFVVLGLVLPYFFGPRPYCKLVCETGYLFDLTSRYSFGRIRRNEGFERDTCLSCQRCTNICPQGINVFEEVNLFDRVVNSGCISCMQCVNTCPNETIVYSLRKKASDTSRVVGYLAALQTRAEDLPRYVLTGLGVFAGAVFGFSVLPPSYFHTYAVFASLGGLAGFLVYRTLNAAFGERLQKWFPAAVSQVEKEKALRIVPLSVEERKAKGATAARRPWLLATLGLLLFAGSGAAVFAISRHVPARIGNLDELPVGLATVEQRHKAHQFFLGVPTETSAEKTQATYAGLRDGLQGKVAEEARLFRADSYGALALALEHEKVDAAFLPGASAHALIRRTHMGVRVVAQTQRGGETTYAGLLVGREGITPANESLFGARVAFVQPDSLSGYIAPVQWLAKNGVRLSDLGEVVFAGNHTQAMSLLASGRVDVAATFDAPLADFLAKNPDAKLNVLARFEGLPNAMLIARGSMSEEEAAQLLAALNAVFTDPDQGEAREALKAAGIDGLVPASVDALYGVGKWLE